MQGDLTLSEKERERLWVLKARAAGRLRAKEAAERLSVTERQLRRLMKALVAHGDVAAVHGLKGRPGNRAFPRKLREKVNRLHERMYADYRPTLFTERLLERHGIEVSRETVRNWLMASGRWKPRRSKRERHPWRERRARFGELVQLDSSIHDWFEGRGEKAVLVAAIDDATSVVFGLFAGGDTVFANFNVIRSWVESHGRPLAFYVDRHTHFSIADEEGVQRSETTQIGRAVGELGIELISAYSPQAKGRVERLFGILQDRLVKALREQKVRTIEDANRFLVTTFWPAYNAQFADAARDPHDAHRPLTGEQRRTLGYIFSWREERTLRPDETIQFEGRHYLLETRGATKLRPGRKVEVLRDESGGIRVVHAGRDLGCREVPAKTKKPPIAKRRLHEVVSKPPPWKPPETHPWRRMGELARPSAPRDPALAPLAACGVESGVPGAAPLAERPFGLARSRRPG